MRKLVLITLTVLLFTGSVAIGQKKRKATPVRRPAAVNADGADLLGALNDNVYSNTFFGLTVPVPPEYTVLNRAQITVYSRAGTDMLKGSSERNNRILDDAVNNSIPLLIVAQKPAGSPGNSAFELQVRKQAAGVTANMVLAQSITVMTGTSKAVLKRSLPGVKFNGRAFVGAEFETEMAGQTLKQTLYVTMQRGYALTIGITEAEGAEPNAFAEMLSAMKLK